MKNASGIVGGSNQARRAVHSAGPANPSPTWLSFGLLVFLGVFLTLSGTANSGPETETDKTVQYLIDYVANSDLVFIRNAARYSGPEAADHMERKYQHFRDEISTPEDFIRVCATKSLMTGKPYRVVTAPGREQMTGEWLLEILQSYRSTSQKNT